MDQAGIRISGKQSGGSIHDGLFSDDGITFRVTAAGRIANDHRIHGLVGAVSCNRAGDNIRRRTVTVQLHFEVGLGDLLPLCKQALMDDQLCSLCNRGRGLSPGFVNAADLSCIDFQIGIFFQMDF